MMDIELLCPAGDMDALIAAVESGANAVYLGGTGFNARQYAGNFDNENMKKAVEFCHLRGVKMFVTVNILTKDAELSDIPEYVNYLYNIGVDALIIQDIGVGKLIKNILPDFELHASTQMTAHNLESVELLYNMGYDRVVLSRELSFEEIKSITSNTKADIEMFVHGALCISYSGQCLMSSMIGGRSGNRGRCAQPCRQKYSYDKGFGKFEESHILSPKDLSTIEHIDRVLKTGVKSLKIEGRMKRPEYVAAVTSIYRRAVDNYINTGDAGVTEEDMKNLLKVFNRGGFTTAHLFKKSSSEMMSFERPKNWGVYIGKITGINTKKGQMDILLEDELSKGDGIEIWTKEGDNKGFTVNNILRGGKPSEKGTAGDKVTVDYKGGKVNDNVYKTFDMELSKSLERYYKSSDPVRKLPIYCEVTVQRGLPIKISMWDNEGNTGTSEGPLPEEALKVPLSESRLREQILKFGGTPFYIEDLRINLDENLSVPVSLINSLRRDTLKKLMDEKIVRFIPKEKSVEITKKTAYNIISNVKREDKKDIKVSVMLKDSGFINSAIEGGADIIIFGGDKLRGFDLDFAKAAKICKEHGKAIYLSSPRIIRNEYSKIASELKEAVGMGADGIYAENLGIIDYAVKNDIPFASGFSMNVFNTVAANVLSDMGSDFISISPELSISDIKSCAPYIKNCEALCYGRVELMVSEYCPAGAVREKCQRVDGKLACEGEDFLIKDRMGMEFPVKTDLYCRSHIYNSKILSVLDSLKDVVNSGVNILRINILDEDEDEVYRIVKAFKEAAVSIASGEDIPESVKSTIDYIKGKGYTKGHYYRGVE